MSSLISEESLKALGNTSAYWFTGVTVLRALLVELKESGALSSQKADELIADIDEKEAKLPPPRVSE